MTSGRSPYKYGASFVDRSTGLRFEAHHPAARPDRWDEYLAGAEREYAKYGLGELIDRQQLQQAQGVALFFVGLDPEGRMVAGVRCHGPLDGPDASQALLEMATSPEADELRRAVGSANPYGVIEIKGAWRETSGDGDHRVTQALSRCCVHALEWLGSEVALAAVADRMEGVLVGSGGLMMGTESAPYPSEKYRTILVSWRRARYGRQADATQAVMLRDESQQLRRPPEPGTVTGWRAVPLDVAHRADRQILANLRDDPSIEVLDVVDRQRAELARLLPAPAPELLEEPPLHVFYPWRRSVVRMLGPKAFPVVRLDRNRNRITSEEQERLASQRVGVVGLSAGHAAATTIALEGLCGEIRLADFDDVELTNLNRLAATVLDVGVNKAVVAARRIAEIDPYLPVQIAPQGLNADNVEDFVAGLDVLVEECDEIAMKVLVREVARRQRVPVVMETSDRGLLDVERFDQEPERPIFHGLLSGVTSSSLGEMTMAEKIPHVLAIVDPERASARGAASLAEIGRTLSTWPQLGADVTLGGATVAATVRRLGLGEEVRSGRIRVDLEAMVGALESPPAPAPIVGPAPPSMPPPPSDPTMVVAHAATLAPSGGNAQPWRLELSDDGIAFILDRTRTSTMDLRARASYVALGAATFNARVAAAATGLLGSLELFPNGAVSDVVAMLRWEGATDDQLASLYPAMLARSANRRMGTPMPVDLSLTARLATAVSAEGATLHLVTDRERMAQCADVLAASDRIRFLTPTLHKEMISELRWPGEDLRTGIDVRTLELAPADRATLGVVRRSDVMELLESWDAGQALGDHTRRAVLSSSALAVVTVPNAAPTSYLRGGAAVERLWISAQQAGLGVQPVSPVSVFAVQRADFEELGGARWADELLANAERFRRIVGMGETTAMALVVRLSHAPPPTARSIRLPLDEVLSHRDRRAGGGPLASPVADVGDAQGIGSAQSQPRGEAGSTHPEHAAHAEPVMPMPSLAHAIRPADQGLIGS